MAENEPTDDGERSRVAPARGFEEPESGPLARREAGAAIHGRRVRADRREGHDRLHDPRGHRPVASSRFAASTSTSTARTSCSSRCSRRQSAKPSTTSAGSSTPSRSRSTGCGRSRSACTSGASPTETPPQARRPQPPPDLGVLGAAHGQPSRAGEGRDGADLAGVARPGRGRRGRQARSTSTDTRRTAALIQQTVMYSWFGNRLIENPRMRVTAERDVGVLPARPRRLTAAFRPRSRSSIRIALPAQHLVALLFGQARGHPFDFLVHERPRRVGVRVVGLEADVVLADRVDRLQAVGIVGEAPEDPAVVVASTAARGSSPSPSSSSSGTPTCCRRAPSAYGIQPI